MPRTENDQGNLIEIINPQKKVGGYTWEAYHKKLTSVGWPDAEQDNYLRAAFNLCDVDEPDAGISAVLLAYANGQIPVRSEEIRDQQDAIMHSVRDEIILKARNSKDFAIDEDKRSSVLFFQEEMNRLENEHFDFNAYYPKPVAQERNVQNENPENVENHRQNDVQKPEEKKEKRALRDMNELDADAEFVTYLLQDAKLWARGSSEYKNAGEKFKRVQERWKKTVNDPEGKVSEAELLSLRGDLINVMYLSDIYLDKKYKQIP